MFHVNLFIYLLYLIRLLYLNECVLFLPRFYLSKNIIYIYFNTVFMCILLVYIYITTDFNAF